MIVSVWTDDLIKSLKELHAANMSCSEIAAALGNGITRNSVIGKVHRLCLAPNAKNNVKKTYAKRKPREKSDSPTRLYRRAPPALNRDRFPAPGTLETSRFICFDELRQADCRWPYGGRDFVYCGAEKREGSSYCTAHHAIAYYPPVIRQR